MDPLSAAIVDVPGKHAIDKGITLLKQAGQVAAPPLSLHKFYRVGGAW